MIKLHRTAILLALGIIVLHIRAQTIDEALKNVNARIEAFSHSEQKDSLAIYLEGRMALFYNNELSDSVAAHAPEDLATLRSLEKWEKYYEVWTHLVNTYIYYNKQKNLALREVQSMFNDALQRNHKYGMGMAYYTMGIVYQNLHNLDESAKSFQKGLDIVKQMSELPLFMPELYSYYGDVLNDQERYRELEILTHSWHSSLETIILQHPLSKDQQDVLWFYYSIACGQAALGMDNIWRAERMLAMAKEMLHEENTYDVVTWQNYMAELRMKQRRYQDAFELNSSRLAKVRDDEDRSEYLATIRQRAQILSAMTRYQEANSLYQEMYGLKDSISNADTQGQLNELNTLFKVDELKMEKERARYRYMLYIGCIVGLALVIFMVIRLMAARRLKVAHKKLQKTHEELQATYEWLEYSVKARELVEGDLRVAREIQLGMLPQDFPDRDDVDLYASMSPAKAVGGDLYCYLLLDDLLYFCVGDVSGKGVPAALFMSQATRLFRSNAKQKLLPSIIANRMNDELTEANEQGMFVTMFMGMINLNTGQMQYCNAGHNPPVMISDDGSAAFLEMNETNAPIGMWPELEYAGEVIDDIRSKALFVYTDGLNEAENRQQEQFGDDRLLELLRQTPFESCRQIVETLQQAVEEHRDRAEPNDDLTMLCVRYASVKQWISKTISI